MPQTDKSKRAEARRRRREQLHAHVANEPLNPDHFYRAALGPLFFGYKMSALYLAIEKGLVPRPIPLTDGGRASGWFGRTILEWQRSREEAARLQQAEA